MKLPENADAKNKKKELETLLQLKSEEIERYKREHEIALALERVREKALAMRSSSDISDATAIVFIELSKLGIEMDRCGIATYNETPEMEVWSTLLSAKDNEAIKITNGKLDYRFNSLLMEIRQHWKEKKDYYSRTYSGDEVKKYYSHLQEAPNYHFPKAGQYPKKHVANMFYFEQGFIFIWTGYVLIEGVKDILKRFTKEFSVTYTRYLDIKKAETQAREAQIEASLERVRAKAMAMRSSKDISGAVAVVFNELTRLGIELERCGITNFREPPIIEIWSTPLSQESKQVVEVITGKINSNIHPMLQKSYKAWKEKKDFFSFELKGPQVKKYYELLEKEPGYNFPKVTDYAENQILNSFNFNKGSIFVYSKEVLPEERKNIFKKFAVVFEQTYTRFLDIQKAEAQAKQAIQQASLDRVRGEIASMRSASDLESITPLIFKELNILGVPFIRCGVFIIQEKHELVEAYLSSPDGNSLGILRLPFKTNELTYQTVEAWRRGEIYTQHWNKENFIQWIKQLMEQDQVQDSSTYQGSAAPPESLDLHFVPFAQGMLYVGAVSPLDEKELELVQALSKTFSIAYSRYEDFVKLEKAKTELESSMNELKATQTQLIQQEKLASLGQLTAGIAHEIKNPLNFVNNFSEVSAELLVEIREARYERRKVRNKRQETKNKVLSRESGKQEEKWDESEELEDEILEDIRQNLEKIQHHGKRADAIVKEMLEHSRTSSGEKLPTDLNALADEYLKLSYHGMRANDKNFNADYNTEFDPNLPKINVIPQDIGRVLLNIINNAFQAVGKGHALSLQPMVTVSTSPLEGGRGVKISISDNGPGIPDAIKDKIFQPFFTTKPAGQGTGLGLSLSYDIVKAHSGELKVKSKEGEGSEFIINLPA